MSAAEGDSIIGTWIFTNNYADFNTTYADSELLYVEGSFYVVSNNNGAISSLDLISLRFASDSGLVRVDITGTSNISTSSRALWFTGDNSSIISKYGSNNNVTTYKDQSPELYNLLCTVEITSESDNPDAYTLLDLFADKYVPPQPRSLLDNILGTFSEVGSWIGTIISSLVALFWSVESASLTFLGILSVAGLAFSFIMLLFGIVTRFVGFSG